MAEVVTNRLRPKWRCVDERMVEEQISEGKKLGGADGGRLTKAKEMD